MDVREFGNALLRTQDLDPVYTALVGAELDPELLSRVCLAYWCFYHLGAACAIAESKNFWTAMEKAAANTDPKRRWPRASERRHFRGAQAIAAVEELKKLKSPNKIVERWVSGGTFSEVARRVQEQRGFGPWIAFKVADMSERVFGRGTDFSDCYLGIYKDPVQGAALVRFGDWKHPISPTELKETYDDLVRTFRSEKAPPHFDRPVNIQEVETICCKFKSYKKGHYYVGKDIREIREGLHGWGDLAQTLRGYMPEEVV